MKFTLTVEGVTEGEFYRLVGRLADGATPEGVVHKEAVKAARGAEEVVAEAPGKR